MTGIVHLVDDDEAVRDGLGLLLSTMGFAVEAYATPAAFLAALPGAARAAAERG